jgi:hypothetical protein
MRIGTERTGTEQMEAEEIGAEQTGTEQIESEQRRSEGTWAIGTGLLVSATKHKGRRAQMGNGTLKVSFAEALRGSHAVASIDSCEVMLASGRFCFTPPKRPN